MRPTSKAEANEQLEALRAELDELRRDNQALEAASHRLHQLEILMRISAALEGHRDLDEMLAAATAALRGVIGCERVFVLHPCRPNTDHMRLVTASTAPGCGLRLDAERTLAVDEELARSLALLLARPGPLCFGAGSAHPLTRRSRALAAETEMWMALRPRVGEPWLLGLHRVEPAQAWTSDEQRLVSEVAARLSELISTFLSIRTAKSNEERFRSLLAALPDLVFVFDAQGYILEIFPLEHDLLVRAPSEVLGRDVSDVLPPAVAEAGKRGVEQTLATGRLQTVEYTLEMPGSVRHFSARMAVLSRDPPRVICVSRDITTRRTLEAQLRQSQKMESVGRLAGGVAHDFNNLLTAVMAHAELALSDIDQASPVREDLAMIRDAAARGAALTQQLLAFARKQVISLEVVNLNDLLLRVDTILRRLIGADIELVTVPDPRLGVVKVDPVQFEQVLMNLAINARDAMPDGGTLLFETSNRLLEPDRDLLRAPPALAPGEYVVLRVTDTGVGMDEETASHVFEPFFTTKEVGKGTGLGLATCYGIVTQCGGELSVTSTPGRGTTFEVMLPRASGRARTSEEEEAPTPPRRGSETVLVVEDEPTVRRVAVRTLRRYGYRVIEAGNGDEALNLPAEALADLHLLVTDVVMPRMSGPQLAEQLQARLPGLRVLFVSGYNAASAGPPLCAHGEAFLQKPFTPGVLARCVRELLDK
ncbi:ATP-binding protein [Haliangium sp.]|uniref:ATP-binding protein n=1 Tax=Haliangium sp. TaxID=2663208 RepID=UPI003D0EFFDA